MCIYIYIVSSEWANCVSTCLCAYLCVCACVCPHACMYTSLYVCAHTCVCVHVCVYMPVCVLVMVCAHACPCVYTYAFVCVCVCIYMHVCMWERRKKEEKKLDWMMAERECVYITKYGFMPQMLMSVFFFYISIKCLKTTVTVCLSFVWLVQSLNILFYSSVNWCVCVCANQKESRQQQSKRNSSSKASFPAFVPMVNFNYALLYFRHCSICANLTYGLSLVYLQTLHIKTFYTWKHPRSTI